MTNESFKNSAHDLNNILTSIINGIELLKQSANKDDETRTLISKLENSTKRAIKIVHTHLSSNILQKKNVEIVNVTEILYEVLDSFLDDEKNFIEINSSSDKPKILIDTTDLYRILYNLVKNALEAIDKNGKIIIEVGKKQVSEKDYVEISIIDNGVGISEDNLTEIFRPKFSTKEKVQESGFGLSIVKEKTEEYNGTITVSSTKGNTIFTVQFPAFDESKKNEKKILLAEDDDSVSEVLADLLKGQGYSVSVASTGYEVLSEINDSMFDILIIDKNMPEMDGIECIKKIRSINKEVPIILASGAEIDPNDKEMSDLNIQLIITKPYNFPEILSALQKFGL